MRDATTFYGYVCMVLVVLVSIPTVPFLLLFGVLYAKNAFRKARKFFRKRV
jgi:uncharacterized membrane protein YbaN (DUF454 family)